MKRHTIIVVAANLTLCLLACASSNSAGAHSSSGGGGGFHGGGSFHSGGPMFSPGFGGYHSMPSGHFEPHSYPSSTLSTHAADLSPASFRLASPLSPAPILPLVGAGSRNWGRSVTEMLGHPSGREADSSPHLSFRPLPSEVGGSAKQFYEGNHDRSARGWGPAVDSDWFRFTPPSTILRGNGWHITPGQPHRQVANPVVMHTAFAGYHAAAPPALPPISTPPGARPIAIVAIPAQPFMPIGSLPLHYWLPRANNMMTASSFFFYPQPFNPFNQGYDESSDIFLGSNLEQRPIYGSDLMDTSTPTGLGGGMIMGYLNRSDTAPPFSLKSPYSLDDDMVFIPDQYGGYWISKSYISTALAQNAGVPSDMVYIPDQYGGYFLSRSYLATALASSNATGQSQMPRDLVYVPDSYGGYFISRSYLSTAMAHSGEQPLSN